ncbi:uncharacterized protein PSFLO_01012 [Pseudozyma flocculosa]|uniref:Uncharacterized protein n=1 Tax=Pseudozyma flocculosa TaxID=84751 RepID=A0A5C3EWR0_9BASI|nr:uncharacterized protein PSFLO_01012 [Pseudozyma flocculosa]
MWVEAVGADVDQQRSVSPRRSAGAGRHGRWRKPSKQADLARPRPKTPAATPYSGGPPDWKKESRGLTPAGPTFPPPSSSRTLTARHPSDPCRRPISHPSRLPAPRFHPDRPPLLPFSSRLARRPSRAMLSTSNSIPSPSLLSRAA